MNKKVAFAFTAIAIMLASSVSSVAGSVSEKQADNAKTIEVPVQIYTLHGVKEIKKELPVNEAKELFSLFNETGEAVKTLLSAHATFGEKLRANVIIDSFLSKMKGYGLLGNLTMHQARELITGKYLQKERNSIEMQKMAMMAKLLENNGWEVNAMCYFDAVGYILGVFPWDIPLIIASYLIDFLQKFLVDYTLLYFLLAGIIVSLDTIYLCVGAIPLPTTVGYWEIVSASAHGDVYIHTLGLLGSKDIGGWAKAMTIGFTGVAVGFRAIGFSPFVAMKPY